MRISEGGQVGQEEMIEFLCGDLATFRAAVLDDKGKSK